MSTLSQRLREPLLPAEVSRTLRIEAADELDRLTARVAELEKMLQPPKQGMLSMSHCGCWKSQYIGEEAHEYKCPTHAALEHKHD